jgi:hypothetical protein
MGSGRRAASLSDAVIRLLVVDVFPRTAEILRADPRLGADLALTAPILVSPGHSAERVLLTRSLSRLW